jgi:anti-sigma-K factor RskA
MDTREQAAAYLLGELDQDQVAEFDRQLQSDPELRGEVEAMRPLLADLEALPGEAWPEERGLEPAPGAIAGAQVTPLTAANTVEDDAAAQPRSGRRLWSLRPAFALGALIVALLFGGAAGALLSGDSNDGEAPPAAALTLQSLSSDSAARGEIAMPEPDEMVLTVSDLPPSPQGQYYELWLLDGAEQTVPVASFRVGSDGTAKLRVPLPADPARYRYFDVSRQHASQGTEHSADSVLRGPTSPS